MYTRGDLLRLQPNGASNVIKVPCYEGSVFLRLDATIGAGPFNHRRVKDCAIENRQKPQATQCYWI